jgi:hypothetical protein
MMDFLFPIHAVRNLRPSKTSLWYNTEVLNPLREEYLELSAYSIENNCVTITKKRHLMLYYNIPVYS